MNRQINEIAISRNQDGAALVVGLVLLMVLTLLAISNMTGSTMEVRQAQNARYKQNAFQSAETGISLAVASNNWSTTTATSVPPVQIPGSPDNYVEYNLKFDEATAVPSGFSIGAGPGFLSYHFDIESTGTSSRGAISTHRQSFYIIGPGGN